MFRVTIVALLSALGIASFVYANQPARSPYAGEETRSIKSLSDREVQNYLAGRGMGLAKAAELNHYPGPAHVLELAERLALSPEQKTRTQTLFKTMETRAKDLGKSLVEQETRLDRLFASRQISREQLKSGLAEIARLQGELRQAHLEAHLTQAEILTHEQTAKYVELRGYGSGAAAGHDTSAHKH
jgi:Spy/CpxP family protein refolding chaperone